MQRHERDFKGVWIPRDIWLSEELSVMEKVLFVEINSLDNERGCFASNAYFAEFFKVSPRQIIRYLSKLKAHGFISVVVHGENERIIRTAGKHRRISAQEIHELRKQQSEVIHKMRVGGRRG